MKRVLPLVASLTLLSPGLLRAQAPAPTPFDPEQLRLQVEALLQLRAQAKATTRAAAIAEIQKRAQSGNGAVNFFESAYAQMNFAGKTSGGQAKVDWTKANADMLNSPEFKAATQLYLQYLALTIERAGSKKPLDFVAPSVKYIQDYTAENTKLFSKGKASDEQKKMLTMPLKESTIVRANELQSLVKDLPDWEMVPGNLDGIFEKNIFGPLRNAKDPRLMDAWKLRIEIADKATSAQKLDSRKGDFVNTQFPNWRFARAEDLLILGNKQEAITEMYLLLQHYPNHPAFEKWGQRLLEILKPDPTPSPTPNS